jgi:hypothetical protein
MELNEDNLELFAAKAYDAKRNPSYEEFQNDLKRVVYINKLLSRHVQTGDIKIRLLLNHCITFFNCFGTAGALILMMRLPEYHSQLKTVLNFLGYLPPTVSFNGVTINTSSIPDDQRLKRKLEEI